MGRAPGKEWGESGGRKDEAGAETFRIGGRDPEWETKTGIVCLVERKRIASQRPGVWAALQLCPIPGVPL